MDLKKRKQRPRAATIAKEGAKKSHTARAQHEQDNLSNPSIFDFFVHGNDEKLKQEQAHPPTPQAVEQEHDVIDLVSDTDNDEEASEESAEDDAAMEEEQDVITIM
ncbi:hypothetical protein CYMTET_30854 [Cymbomonas tetramitiformis]|uniref:Uncharacterized protein n=1 Tax=Cymbomonas tetramitiformis TaxID=36881 RepID=A0AAE0FII1_9CHLO|nr:hypothetical protein CYMTET_30854 [Cymbomonas tetramitiformis]